MGSRQQASEQGEMTRVVAAGQGGAKHNQRYVLILDIAVILQLYYSTPQHPTTITTSLLPWQCVQLYKTPRRGLKW